MAITKIGNIDFSEWLNYKDVIARMLVATPSTQRSWLRNVAGRYREEIQSEILAKGISTTGTYEKSIKIIEEFNSDKPSIKLAIIPEGANADRLYIYWKTLERGSSPIPNVPRQAIQNWASTKFSANTVGGSRLANHIRKFGVQPHPILSKIFIISFPEGVPIGVTTLGQSIAEKEAELTMKTLLNVFYTTQKTGRVVAQLKSGTPGGRGGQFTKVG